MTETVLGLCSAGLALNATMHRPLLWPLFALTAFAAAFSGVDSSARSAAMASIVGRQSYASANALWQLLFQTGQIVGPAIAGLLIGHVGISAVYWADTGSFGVALASVIMLQALPAMEERTRFGVGSIAEGFRFLKGRQALQGTFVVDLDAMIFGMPRALFPAIGLDWFRGGATTVGLLYAAPGAGAFLGALLTGWVSSIRRQGRAVIIAVAVWGVAIVAFGLSHWLVVSLVMLGVAGAADVISAVFRNTILQSIVPDSLRGRLSSIHIAVVSGGPRLGDTEAGAVAAVAGVRFSAVSGGVLCLAGLVGIAALMPRFTDYHAEAIGPPGAAGETISGEPVGEPFEEPFGEPSGEPAGEGEP